jgi:hypothetical protein
MTSLCSPCVCVSRLSKPEEKTIGTQRLDEHGSAAMNIHSTTKEMLNAVLSMRSGVYQIRNM